MSSRQPSDIAARRAALNPQKSFAVRAPAGSGKTELLTQRVMSLLSYCEKPEEVLAITFTKKAAAEMRERIITALRRAQNPLAPEQEHDCFTWELAKKVLKRSEQQQWGLLENPNRLRIQTIDSFCRSLSGQQPVSSQLGTLPDTLDDQSGTAQTLQRAFRETLNELKTNSTTTLALKNILLHFDNDVERLEKLIISMLAKRDQWLEHILRLTDELHIQESNQLLVEHLLQQAYDALRPWQGQITLYFNHALDNYAATDREKILYASGNIKQFPKPSADNLEIWRDIFKFLTTDHGLRKPKGLNAAVGIPPDSPLKKEIQNFFSDITTQTGIEDILMFCKLVPDHPVNQTQLAITQDIRRVLLTCVANLKLLFNQLRATDYTEIALAALDALGSEEQPSDLSLKLDYRLKHILIDEFQDTSHLQLRLLKKLTSGWQPDDGHSLFIVGDAMQSCYSFRNADVRIFLNAIKEGIGDLPLTTLTLTENFRSESSIVDWNNRLFSHAFPSEVNINLSAVPYNPSIAYNQHQREDPVQCYSFPSLQHAGNYSEDKQEAYDDALVEAEKIVSIISKIQHGDPQESIALLIRNRNHVQAILPALNAANIAWQATDMDKLSQRMAIMDLKTLTRALLYPADHLSWLGLLRSPIAGLSLADLLLLSNVSDESSPQRLPIIMVIQNSAVCAKLSIDGQKILRRITPVLLQALAQQQRKPLRQWIEGLWYSLAGPAGCDPQQLTDSYAFFDLLEKSETNGQIVDWPLLENAVDTLYANDVTGHKNPVHIMTIHKAKGLEFDHVILPGLAKKARNNDSELFMWNDYFLDDDKQVLILGPADEKGSDKSSSHIDFIKSIQKKKSDYETLRLLYVACTRAKQNLYLLGSTAINKDGESVAPNRNSLLFPIWQDFIQQCTFIESKNNQPEPTEKKSTTLEHIRRIPAEYQALQLPECNDLMNYRGHEYEDDDNMPECTSLDNFCARQTGTVIHKLLQDIATDGINKWQSTPITIHQTNWSAQLTQLGVPLRLIPGLINNIRDAINAVISSEQGRWILDNNHKKSRCEFELSYNGKTSILDRFFIDKETCWIIDYKSSLPADNQSIDDFLAEQITKYASQLKNYAFLMQKIEALPIKTALYFPKLDKLVTL